MIRILVVVLVLALPLSAVRLQADQQSEPQPLASRPTSEHASDSKGYLQVGLLLIVQPSGVPNHRVSPAINGTTPGVAVVVGTFVTSTLAVEGECVLQRTISTSQRFSYDWFEDFTGQSRDLLFNGNLRWRPHGTSRLEVSGGGGLAMTTFAERSIVVTDFFPTRTSTRSDSESTSWHLTLGGSVAAALPIGPKVAFVPTFSLRWVRRPPGFYSNYLGVGSFAFHVAAVLRARF
jgi:hypothetical protein